MNNKVKNFLIFGGITLAILGAAAAVLIHGAYTYTSRCAHIKAKENVTVQAGDVLDIDDLAEFTNYDERRITGITGVEGEISADRQQVVVEGPGEATVWVFATNARAPERTEKEIHITVKGEDNR